MLEARRKSSTKLYTTYIRKWTEYCQMQNIDPIQATVDTGLGFLSKCFDESDRKYSSLNTARLALSLVIVLPSSIQFGTHPDMVAFMKGVNNLRPSVLIPGTQMMFYNF